MEKLWKTNKKNWRSRQKAIEEHEKELAESNEIIKKDFNINRETVYHLMTKGKKLMNLMKKDLPDVEIYKKELNLIIWFISTK